MKADCSECCDILLPPRAFPVVQKFNIRLLVNPSPEANCLCVPLHSSLPLRSVQPFAMLWTGGLAVSTRFLQTLETEFKQKFERKKGFCTCPLCHTDGRKYSLPGSSGSGNGDSWFGLHRPSRVHSDQRTQLPAKNFSSCVNQRTCVFAYFETSKLCVVHLNRLKWHHKLIHDPHTNIPHDSVLRVVRLKFNFSSSHEIPGVQNPCRLPSLWYRAEWSCRCQEEGCPADS